MPIVERPWGKACAAWMPWPEWGLGILLEGERRYFLFHCVFAIGPLYAWVTVVPPKSKVEQRKPRYEVHYGE